MLAARYRTLVGVSILRGKEFEAKRGGGSFARVKLIIATQEGIARC
jgi:hypothetical protein